MSLAVRPLNRTRKKITCAEVPNARAYASGLSVMFTTVKLFSNITEVAARCSELLTLIENAGRSPTGCRKTQRNDLRHAVGALAEMISAKRCGAKMLRVDRNSQSCQLQETVFVKRLLSNLPWQCGE